MLATYDLLSEAGRDLGLADVGLYAMDSLRLEKGHRRWKQDLLGDCSPLAASLDRFVDLDKPDFIGRAALLAEAQRGVKERLVPLLVEATRPTRRPAPACGGTGGAWVCSPRAATATAWTAARARLAARRPRRGGHARRGRDPGEAPPRNGGAGTDV